MALDTFSPAYAPSLGSGMTWAARLIETNFGDGYRQTAADGLNAVVGTLQLSWDALPSSAAAAIDNFFKAHVGKAFFYTPVSYGQLQFDCKQWSRTNVYGGIDKMSATLVQRFDLG